MKKILLKIVCLIAACIFSSSTHAQIIYTDIKDITYTCNKKCGNNCYSFDCSKTYALDLNKDGTTDFNITSYIQARNYDGGIGGYCHCFEIFFNSVYTNALNDNSVVRSSVGSALTAGSNISSLSEWATGSGSLKSVSQDCYGWTGECMIQSWGDWPNSSDRYLGLKIIVSGQTYYGWARLSVSVDKNKSSFKITEYAYESTPDRSIIAGDKGIGAIAHPTKITIEETEADPTQLRITPNPSSSQTQISFNVEKSGKVLLHVFDLNGKLIKTIADRNFEAGVHQLQLDTKNLIAGIYILKLQSEGSIQTRKLIVIK